MTRVATAAALLGLCCAAAFAQTEPETQFFSANNFHCDLELRYDLQQDYLRDKQLLATTQTVDEQFDEIMTLSADGFIYHPRLLVYKAAVGLDLTQGEARIEAPGANAHSSLSGIAPEYAISGSLLPQNAISLDFSLNQYTSTLNPPFSEVTRTDGDNELVTLWFRSGPLPTQIAYGHDSSSQTQMGIGENRYLDDSWGQITVNNNTARSASILTYKYLQGHEEDEEVSAVTSQFRVERDVQDATFNNALQLGDGNWATLTSRAAYEDETGTFPWEEFTEDESLVLKHTKSLSTQYGFDYSEITVGASTTELTALQASVTHQLYESLLSYGRIYGSHEDFGGSSEDIGGLSLQETYHKRIPWGTLTVNAGAGYSITDDRTQPGLVSIVNESQTLSDTATTFLNNPNVVASTVVVTNTSNTITYLLNVDYTLTPHGTLTQIQRLPAGAIANGTSVLVNYQYQSGLPVEYGTTDLHGRVTLDLFNHLTLYVNRESLENSVLSGTNQGQFQNLEETLYGATLRWDPATVTAEHEIYDSSLSPYTSDMVSFNLASPVGETQRVGANAMYRHVTYETEGEGALTMRTAGLSYQMTPKNWPSFNVTAGYECDNEQGVSNEYVYGRIALEYRIRDTIFSLEYQINRQNDPTARELSQYAFFSIRRRLF
jgi:hypothetical protein